MKKFKKRLTATILTMLMATSTLAIQPSDTYAATKQVQTIALNTKSKELYVDKK